MSRWRLFQLSPAIEQAIPKCSGLIQAFYYISWFCRSDIWAGLSWAIFQFHVALVGITQYIELINGLSEVGKLWPTHHIRLTAYFYKVLLEHNHAHLFMFCLCYFCPITAEVGTCDKDYLTHRFLPSELLQKNLLTPSPKGLSGITLMLGALAGQLEE